MMYEYNAKVLNIVDGDTVDLEIDVGFSISIKQRARLLGIDAPESKTKNLEEKALGLKAKKALQDLTKDNSSVIIKTHKDDKYGRLLVEIFINGVNINQKLISEGYAWSYSGATKTKDLTKLGT